jgi:hypothetical protein
LYRATPVDDVEAALESFRTGHRDRPDELVSQVLLHFERQTHRLILNFIFDRQGVVDPGQRVRKFHVDDRPDDLNDFAFAHMKNLFSNKCVIAFRISRPDRRQFPTVPS